MTARTNTFVDFSGPWRTWLRGHLPVLGNRVFMALPEQCSYPAIEFTTLDGGIDRGEAPIANVLVSHSIWSTNLADVEMVYWQLISLLHTIEMEPAGSIMLLGAQVVNGPLVRHDQDKFVSAIVDASVSVIHV